MSEEKINQLQMYEQSLQGLLVQKQHFQSQLTEIDSALKEIDSSKDSFKIIGNIMVKTSKDDLKKELTEKKSSLTLRIGTLEKQEEGLKDKAKNLQSEVMKNMKDEK